MGDDYWAQPNQARRAHRFRYSVSLCGRWTCFSPPARYRGLMPVTHPPSPEAACRACARALSEEQNHER